MFFEKTLKKSRKTNGLASLFIGSRIQYTENCIIQTKIHTSYKTFCSPEHTLHGTNWMKYNQNEKKDDTDRVKETKIRFKCISFIKWN